MHRALFRISRATKPPPERAPSKAKALYGNIGHKRRVAMSAAQPLYDLNACEQIQLLPSKANIIVAREKTRGKVRPKPELAFYRKYTEAMLRRYMRLYMSVGRMPALLGHDPFRGKMSTYRVTSFEDSVIFVYDVEKCIKRLDGFSQELIRRIALQEYTQGEAAGLLGVSLRTIVRRYGDAIDALTQIFIKYRLLDIDPMDESSKAQ
jgi:predicted DNA-binding protein (UPF0251 family)